MALAVAIVGPGALGTSMGRVLERGGARVSYVGRGGRVVGGAPLEEIVDSDVARGLDWPDDPAWDERVVLVTTKAYASKEVAFDHYLSELFQLGSVVSLQNGLGNVEALAASADPYALYAGATTHAATRAGGGVETIALGETVIAPWPSLRPNAADVARGLAETLSAHGLPTRAVDDPSALLWRKVVVSCGINALTAIERCTNGALLERPAALGRAIAAAEEARQTGLARGVDLARLDAEKTLRAVCERTARNRSSMLQDIEAGRRTEVREINGAVVAEAAKSHLKQAPVNAALLEEILSLEARRPRESAPQETLTRHGR